MSCFHVSTRGFDCARAVRSLNCVCSDPGTHVLRFGFRVGVRTLTIRFLSSSECAVFRSTARSPVHVCFVVLHAVHVSIGCMHSCYILCCVARSLCISLAASLLVVMSCVNTWLMCFLISCLFLSCFAHGW